MEPSNDQPKVFPWHAREKEQVFNELGLNADYYNTGLTSVEAATRLANYGPNKMSEKEKVTLLQRIWKQVANLLVAILVFVAVVSAIQAMTADNSEDITTNSIQVSLILFVITVNTIIGIVQEGSAEKAADALKAMLSSDAVVVRDGKDVKIPADQIVPGDIVRLSLGDKVPADLRMLEVSNLAALEAALTGEAVPIEKTVDSIFVDGDPNSQPLGDRHNMCYSATLISQGSGLGVVVATGDNTEIGTINALVNKVEAKKTNVLKQIDNVSFYLFFFICMTSLASWNVAFFMTGQDALVALSTASTLLEIFLYFCSTLEVLLRSFAMGFGLKLGHTLLTKTAAAATKSEAEADSPIDRKSLKTCIWAGIAVMCIAFGTSLFIPTNLRTKWF